MNTTDTTTITTTPASVSVAPAAPVEKSRRTRSLVNRAWLKELSLSNEVCTAAEKADYLAALAEEAITPEQVATLRTKLEQITTKLAKFGSQASTGKVGTQDEGSAKQALLDLIDKAQISAKRRFPEGHARRDAYYIGQTIESNRALLLLAAQSILNALAEDNLPAMTPARVEALTAARLAYAGAQTSQSAGQTAAAETRGTVEQEIKEIAELRREIQYAADARWPARAKVHAAVRRAFKIPVNRQLA